MNLNRLLSVTGIFLFIAGSILVWYGMYLKYFRGADDLGGAIRSWGMFVLAVALLVGFFHKRRRTNAPPKE